MNFLEIFLILYVTIGFVFVFLGTLYLGNEKIVETITPHMNVKMFGLFHHFIFLVMVFGFLLPKPLLKYHLVALTIGFFHWQTNKQECVSTEIQRKLINDNNYSFFKDTIFQGTITTNQAFYISYIVFFISFCISLWRLLS